MNRLMPLWLKRTIKYALIIFGVVVAFFVVIIVLMIVEYMNGGLV